MGMGKRGESGMTNSCFSSFQDGGEEVEEENGAREEGRVLFHKIGRRVARSTIEAEAIGLGVEALEMAAFLRRYWMKM